VSLCQRVLPEIQEEWRGGWGFFARKCYGGSAVIAHKRFLRLSSAQDECGGQGHRRVASTTSAVMSKQSAIRSTCTSQEQKGFRALRISLLPGRDEEERRTWIPRRPSRSVGGSVTSCARVRQRPDSMWAPLQHTALHTMNPAVARRAQGRQLHVAKMGT
jgi:hypothetical protein